MTYFPDLSRYVYTSADAPMLNVGWLGKGEPFATGAVDPVVRDQLIAMAMEPANVSRGLHYCELCEAESPIPVAAAATPDRIAYLGTGEVHVAPEGVVYAAPTLVIHYIDAHGYRPPREFCDAVRRLAHAEAGLSFTKVSTQEAEMAKVPNGFGRKRSSVAVEMDYEVFRAAAVSLATSVRMGEGVSPDELSLFRESLASASRGWRAAGQLPRGVAAVLVEIYPALMGSAGLYAREAASEIADLAEELLDEILRALAD